MLWVILQTSIISPHSRLYLRVERFKWNTLSQLLYLNRLRLPAVIANQWNDMSPRDDMLLVTICLQIYVRLEAEL